jgi:hypothetical protein
MLNYIVLMTLIAFSKSAPPPPQPVVTEISISKGPCYGACPIFEAKFYSNGSATFHGEKPPRSNVGSKARIGDFEGKITAAQYANLEKTLLDNKFFESSDYKENVTDLPRRYIGAIKDSTEKKILLYGIGVPQNLKTIESTLDSTIEQIEWKQIESLR